MGKSNLKKIFIEFGKNLTPEFSIDKSLNKIDMYAIHRRVSAERWEYIALFVSKYQNEIFMEVAISPHDSFPGNTIPGEPDEIRKSGIIRFRANRLWTKKNSFGWLIEKKPDAKLVIAGFEDISLNPIDLAAKYKAPINNEGIYESYEEAFENMKRKIKEWVLPYFDKMTSAHVSHNK